MALSFDTIPTNLTVDSFGVIRANSNATTWETVAFSGQSNQTLGAYGVGNTTQSSSGTIDARSLSFSGAGGVSVGVSNGSVLISGATGGGGGSNTLGMSNLGNTAGTSGAVSGANVAMYLAGGNNVTLSQSINGSSATVTISGADFRSHIFGVSTEGNTQNDTGPIYSANINAIFAGSNGITLDVSKNFASDAQTIWIKGVTQTVQTQNMVSLQGSTGNISFGNANGITFGGNASTLTASHNGLTSQSNQAVSAANGSYAFQTLSLSNANGISFGTSAGSAVTASHNAITSQSNQQISAYAVGNTTQSSSGTANASNLSFRGEGVASVGVSNGSVVVSVPAGGGGLTNINLSAGTTSQNLSKFEFNNANGLTFGLNGSTITASHNGLTSQSNQAVSAANGSFTFQTLSFADSNNVTFSTGTQGVFVSFNPINIGVSTGGNTSGTTGTIDGAGAQYIFVGGNNITLSQSINGSSATVTISGGAGGAGGGATVSKWPMYDVGMAYSTVNSGTTGGTGGSTQVTVSAFVASLPLEHDIHFSQLCHYHSGAATVAGTGSVTVGHMLGLYTLNANTALSSLSSWQAVMEMSQNSVTARTHRWYWGTNSTSNSSSLSGNVSASFTAGRVQHLQETGATIPAGNYYLVYMHTARSSSVAVYHQSSVGFVTGSQTTGAPFVGAAGTSRPYGWAGVFSTTTNNSAMNLPAMPASIHTSAITHTGGSTQWRQPYILMQRSIT